MIRADSSAIQCRVLRSLTIISHRFRFVKGFFKSFLKTFSTTFQPERKCPSIISHPLAFVKRFFKSFSTFFVIFFEAVSRGRPLVDSLHIIALSFPFVNRFLQSFLSLELRAVLYKRRAWSLYTMPKYWRFSPSNRHKSRSDPTFFRGDRSNGRPPHACGSDRRIRPVHTCRRPRSPRR